MSRRSTDGTASPFAPLLAVAAPERNAGCFHPGRSRSKQHAAVTGDLRACGFSVRLRILQPRRAFTRGLFALIQVMYLSFYLAALFRLLGVLGIAESFLPGWGATLLLAAVMITAGVGIPLRCYLLSAVGFDYQRLSQKFRQMFPFVLVLDELWAVAPFLLIHQIGLGAAFAASAALLYVPFSERTLIRLAYVESKVRTA